MPMKENSPDILEDAPRPAEPMQPLNDIPVEEIDNPWKPPTLSADEVYQNALADARRLPALQDIGPPVLSEDQAPQDKAVSEFVAPSSRRGLSSFMLQFNKHVKKIREVTGPMTRGQLDDVRERFKAQYKPDGNDAFRAEYSNWRKTPKSTDCELVPHKVSFCCLAVISLIGYSRLSSILDIYISASTITLIVLMVSHIHCFRAMYRVIALCCHCFRVMYRATCPS